MARLVHGATHLFDEPGALDTAIAAASEWFVEHLKNIPVGHSLGW